MLLTFHFNPVLSPFVIDTRSGLYISVAQPKRNYFYAYPGKSWEMLPDIAYKTETTLKGSISLKNRHFIIQERLNRLIYGINTII